MEKKWPSLYLFYCIAEAVNNNIISTCIFPCYHSLNFSHLTLQIREEIEQYGIKIYQFPDCDSDEDEEFKQQDLELKVSVRASRWLWVSSIYIVISSVWVLLGASNRNTLQSNPIRLSITWTCLKMVRATEQTKMNKGYSQTLMRKQPNVSESLTRIQHRPGIIKMKSLLRLLLGVFKLHVVSL